MLLSSGSLGCTQPAAPELVSGLYAVCSGLCRHRVEMEVSFAWRGRAGPAAGLGVVHEMREREETDVRMNTDRG